MRYWKRVIVIVAIVIIIMTLRIKRTDDSVTVQFGLWQLIKDYLNK